MSWKMKPCVPVTVSDAEERVENSGGEKSTKGIDRELWEAAKEK